MSTSPSYSSRWKWRALAVLPILLLSFLPQIQFWLDRGSQWHGAYATVNADEFLYSGYLNALIDGRPRRNDPFTGRDDQAGAPLPETAFSIQVVPPFILSNFARVFGITASTAFIALAGISGLLASLSIFWLLFSITSDERLAATGALFVLLAGTLFAGQGLIGVLLKLDIVALGLPFLRRYQPAASFYLFFIFCTLIWHSLTMLNALRARLVSLLAGITLAVLVFSYLYLWTAAVAWVACVVLLWLLLQPVGQRRRSIEVFAITGIVLTFALVPYAFLVSHRSHTLDELQTLISTHQPDLFRIPEILGALVAIALIIGVALGKIKRDDRRMIFAASFALLPMIVFNQQILTGRSMQPFHFETFVINYSTLVSLVILATLLRKPIPSRSLLWIAAFCVLLGLVEVQLARAFYPSDAAKDEMIPAMHGLKEYSRNNSSADAKLVFSPHFELMQVLPTWAPQGTLLAMGAIDFGSASHQERKEFLYAHLYYSGVTADHLRELFKGVRGELPMSYYVKYVIFGHERVRPAFALNFQPITQDEIEKEVNAYTTFADSFSRSDASRRPISYVVTLASGKFDFSRIDRWYERDEGEQAGAYTLYRLRLRE